MTGGCRTRSGVGRAVLRVGEIHKPQQETPPRTVAVGDWGRTSLRREKGNDWTHSLSETRKYPVVVALSEEDTLDDEALVDYSSTTCPRSIVAREEDETDRGRRIGFRYSGLANHDAGGG